MKLTKITSIAIIVITAIMLTGCQDEQLTQCRLENEELQKTIKDQQLKISKMGGALLGSSQMLTDFIKETEKLTDEVKTLKEGAQQDQPEPQTQKPAQRPEQKAKIQKGLQELFEMQRKPAERMKKESQ